MDWSTLVVVALIVFWVVFVAWILIKRWKEYKNSSCGCGCAECMKNCSQYGFPAQPRTDTAKDSGKDKKNNWADVTKRF